MDIKRSASLIKRLVEPGLYKLGANGAHIQGFRNSFLRYGYSQFEESFRDEIVLIQKTIRKYFDDLMGTPEWLMEDLLYGLDNRYLPDVASLLVKAYVLADMIERDFHLAVPEIADYLYGLMSELEDITLRVMRLMALKAVMTEKWVYHFRSEAKQSWRYWRLFPRDTRWAMNKLEFLISDVGAFTTGKYDQGIHEELGHAFLVTRDPELKAFIFAMYVKMWVIKDLPYRGLNELGSLDQAVSNMLILFLV
jgi:hypothetical protein